MAVTRRVHVVKMRPVFDHQIDVGGGREFAQIYSDPAVMKLMSTFAPAERTVGITSFLQDSNYYVYIFTESFGLGPITP